MNKQLGKEERLYKVILAPHVSEKTTRANASNNVIVFRVALSATKAEIKAAVEKLFEEAKVLAVRTLVCKGKTKRRGAKVGRRSDWKKAYVTLEPDSKIDFGVE